MGREGRGTPGRFTAKDHRPKLRLEDLLRRRRTTLAAFVAELGVTTYAALLNWCTRTGVLAPSPEEFTAAFPAAARVNSPQEGVVVLEAPRVISEVTGDPIDLLAIPEPEDDALAKWPVQADQALVQPTEATQKKPRRKKDDQPSEA